MKKIYNHLLVERKKNEKWKRLGVFEQHYEKTPAFSILLPPPNITGMLHMGHALNLFIQDTIIRYQKLKGMDVLFLPCMDHAGIATQAKIDEELYKKGKNRKELSRCEFLEFADQWKATYQAKIREQWIRLGPAFDWGKERFTLDEEANKFVNKTFIKMYQDGLIYQDTKGIAWDCKMLTAISNIEIIHKQIEQNIYYVRYPFVHNPHEYLVIATTRPETIGSDVAVALNPKDSRTTKLKGLEVFNPLTSRKLPIITHESIDMFYGSGIMKISAHSLQDLEIIKEKKLEVIETIDEKGYIYNLNERFNGLERFEAKQKIYAFLKEKNLIEKVELTQSNIGFSQRSNTVVEFLNKKQWFVRMKPLAALVLESLKRQEVEFFPKRFSKTMQNWMEEVHDWTISRQLWWGHQIPAWYKNDQLKVQVHSPGEGWIREEDVLDTWFSSALIPMSFFQSENGGIMSKFFPTSILVTAYDIIFFWVARMYFQTLYQTQNIPFKQVLIHGLIRDSQGRKMSKSLGNGIEPMEVIEEYGADALRLFLLFHTTPGNDIKFSYTKIKAAWNFLNKIWNIVRFVKTFSTKVQVNQKLDNWIEAKLVSLQQSIDNYMKNYEFSLVFKVIQHFVLDTVSSIYLEYSKTFYNPEKIKDVLQKTLIIIHPFIPFLSDHLYFELFNAELLESYPSIGKNWALKSVKEEESIEKTMRFIRLIRNFKSQRKIGNTDKIKLWIVKGVFETEELELIKNAVNCAYENNNDFLLKDLEFEVYISTSKAESFSEEMSKKLKYLENEIQRCTTLLNTDGFVTKAPKVLVKKEEEKLKMFQKRLEELRKK